MRNEYSSKHFKFILKNEALSFEELRSVFNEKFDLSCSLSAIKTLRKRNPLKMPTGRTRLVYSLAERDFIKRHSHLNIKELYRLYVECFGQIRSQDSISRHIRDQGLRGKPSSRRSIEINGQKIALNRFVWECVNGPLPPDHCVIFLDGDVNNYCINNLKAIHQTAIRMAAGWLGSKLSNVKEPAFAVCALQHQIQQHE